MTDLSEREAAEREAAALEVSFARMTRIMQRVRTTQDLLFGESDPRRYAPEITVRMVNLSVDTLS